MLTPIAEGAAPSAGTGGSSRQTDLYLDLMKKCLTHSLWFEQEEEVLGGKRGILPKLFGASDDPGKREKLLQDKLNGRVWPQFAHTMIGFPRLNNLEFCVRGVLDDNIPGDFIETGVWRGGACIFMRAILKAYGVTDRRVWVADSFEGLPRPDPKKSPVDKGNKLYTFKELAISIETVQGNFRAYGLLDDQVKFLKGWFKDTLPTAPIEKLAVARLDGDMYESTMDAFVNLYSKLSVGGYLICDDYGAVRRCREAVHDFREKNRIKEEMVKVDHSGIFWRKER
jgi:hypothetical protein